MPSLKSDPTTDNLASQLRNLRRSRRAQRTAAEGSARQLAVVAFTVPAIALVTLIVVMLSVLLLAGNAFFVGAEFALISARRSSIEPLAQQGDRREVGSSGGGGRFGLAAEPLLAARRVDVQKPDPRALGRPRRRARGDPRPGRRGDDAGLQIAGDGDARRRLRDRGGVPHRHRGRRQRLVRLCD